MRDSVLENKVESNRGRSLLLTPHTCAHMHMHTLKETPTHTLAYHMHAQMYILPCGNTRETEMLCFPLENLRTWTHAQMIQREEFDVMVWSGTFQFHLECACS